MAMIDLNIDGIGTVKVDESFKNLTRQQQSATVEEIVAAYNQRGPKDTSFSTAFMKGIDDPLNRAGQTIEMLGGETVGQALQNALDTPDNYESASERFINPEEGDFTIGGFAPGYLPRAAAEQAGQFFGSLASRGIGAAGGGLLFGPGGAVAGGVFGPAAFEFIQQLGPVAAARAQNQGRQEPNWDDWSAAAATAGASGALNALGVNQAGILNRMFKEGATEMLQSGVQQGGETLATEAGLQVDPKQMIGEGIIGGTSAGGIDTTTATVRGAGKAVDSAIDAIPTEYKNVVRSDEEATADFVRDLQTMASDFDGERDLNKLDDADATIDDLHSNYLDQFNTLVAKAKAAGVDVNSAEFKSAARRAKNKLKNEASKQDIRRLEAIDPELAALARKLNVVTRFKRAGVKGGVSRFTDNLSPLQTSQGAFGRTTAGMRRGVATGLALVTDGATLVAPVAGRAIDKVTGSRNRIKSAIKTYSNAPGITIDPEAGEVQSREQEAIQARETAAQERTAQTQQQRAAAIEAVRAGDPAPAPEGNLSPQATVEQATGLDRTGVAKAIRILKQTRPHLKEALKQYEVSVAMQQAGPQGGFVDNLTGVIRAIKNVAEKTGIEQVNTPNPNAINQVASNIRNPRAYNEAVNRAVQARDIAVQAAPSPAMAQVANQVADARTRALKQEAVARAKAQFPEHAEYIDQQLEPMTQFGPKDTTVPEVQESRFNIDERLAENATDAGERMMALHHGTKKGTATVVEVQGFPAGRRVFMAAVPEEADSFAQQYRGQPDNGRVTVAWPESTFNRLMNNGLITRRQMEGTEGTMTEYIVAPEAFDQAYDVFRSRSLFEKGQKLSDRDKAKLIAKALTEGFKFETDSSENSFNRRQQLIKLTSDADKRTVLHEIFHAVEDRLSEGEMNKLKSHPLYKEVMTEVEALYPELNDAAKSMEALAEMSARLQEARDGRDGVVKYILSRIKDLIQRFESMLKGEGFMTVNSVLDEVYTGKAYQRGINEAYADMFVPTTQFAKTKPGGPMLAKRRADLDKIEQDAKDYEARKPVVRAQFEEATEAMADNLDIEGVTPQVLRAMLSGITPETDLTKLALGYLRGIGVITDDGKLPNVVETKEGNEVEEALEPHRDNFLMILKAMQDAKMIGPFDIGFRTSAGGVMYPVYNVAPLDPVLTQVADLNNARKYKNRATAEPMTGKPQINSHPLGSYENTAEFIQREMQQPLVINDQIYKLLKGIIDKPRLYRGLDLMFKKDGTTDSAYTLAAAEAVKQYEDNTAEDAAGMSPVYMLRRAQDRLRIDTLNGSASYQGKAGKAIWEFPNWRPLGETGFESFLHSIRDHLGIGNEVPYNQRAGILFGTVRQYMELAGRPMSENVTDEDLDMPLIDYMVSGSKMPGGNVFSYQRGGAPMLFNDKRDGKTVYQKNHAVFDVADHGFEIQRLAIELGRMRAYLESKNKDFKKIPTSELFQRDDALELLMDFQSSYPVWFDGTSSAYQLHAALTGDANLAQVANLLGFDPDAPGGDLYRLPADHIQEVTGLGSTKSRKVAKKFLANRRSYGQVKITARGAGFDELAKQLPDQFNDMTDETQKQTLRDIQNQLELVFDTNYPGAAMAEGIAKSIAKTMLDLYGKDNFAVRVPLPDGDVSVYSGKLPDSAKRRVTWNIGKDKRMGVPVYQDKLAITGFAAFLNHSLDAYIQRELAKRLRLEGVPGFMHTHDAFAVHPQYGQRMREIYHQLLLEIAQSPIYEEVAKANGIDPNTVIVKFNTQSENGPVEQEMTLAEALRLIRQMKEVTFSNPQGVNLYALS